MRRHLLVLAVLALLASACEVTIAVDVQVDADGGGRFELAFRLDELLVAEMEEIGFDPLLGLADLAERAPGWTVRTESGDSLLVRVGRDFEDPGDLARLADDLQAGFDDQDGRLLERLRLTVADDGRLTVEAAAGLQLPATAGAEGDGIVFDGDALADLVAERGDELIRAEMRVRFPGSVERSDADDVDGSVATWRLPVGEVRSLSASAYPERGLPWPQVLAVFAVALALGALIAAVRRRRVR